jgi:hypothetical protein
MAQAGTVHGFSIQLPSVLTANSFHAQLDNVMMSFVLSEVEALTEEASA